MTGVYDQERGIQLQRVLACMCHICIYYGRELLIILFFNILIITYGFLYYKPITHKIWCMSDWLAYYCRVYVRNWLSDNTATKSKVVFLNNNMK